MEESIPDLYWDIEMKGPRRESSIQTECKKQEDIIDKVQMKNIMDRMEGEKTLNTSSNDYTTECEEKAK